MRHSREVHILIIAVLRKAQFRDAVGLQASHLHNISVQVIPADTPVKLDTLHNIEPAQVQLIDLPDAILALDMPFCLTISISTER